MTIKFRKGDINPTTKTFPRTLAEAFPENPEPNFEEDGIDKEDKMVIISCIVIAIILFILITWGTLWQIKVAS